MHSRMISLPALAFLGAALTVTAQWEGNVPLDAIPPEMREALEKAGLTLEEASRIAAENRARRERERNQEAEETVAPRPEAVREAPVSAPIAPAPYPWPRPGRALPLEAEISIEHRDGFPERFVTFSGSSPSFAFRPPPGLAVEPERGDASAVLVNPLAPVNRLEVYLFPPGAFLPDVNRFTLAGYVRALETDYDDGIEIRNRDRYLPRKTFEIYGEPWGLVRYDLAENGEEPTAVADFMVRLRGNLLVLRLSGRESWVEGRMGAVQSALSGLEILESTGTPQVNQTSRSTSSTSR